MKSGIITIAVSFLWLGSEIFLALKKRSVATDVKLDKSSIRILWITIFVSVNLGILFSSLRIGSVDHGLYLFPMSGIMLIVCGLCIRWIAIISLKNQFTVDVSIRKDHRIVNVGIYRYVRHPSYTGSLVSFLGLGFCFSNYVSVAVIFIPVCFAFLHRIRIEEEALIQTFGNEYRDYCATTKRLLPGIY